MPPIFIYDIDSIFRIDKILQSILIMNNSKNFMSTNFSILWKRYRTVQSYNCFLTLKLNWLQTNNWEMAGSPI